MINALHDIDWSSRALSGPFSQVVVASGSRTVYIAGQVSLDADGALVGGDDAGAQAEQCLAYIGRALAAAGAGPVDVARVTVYLTDIGDRAVVAEARARFFGDHRPAATLFEVSALALPELLVEIEAVAVVA